MAEQNPIKYSDLITPDDSIEKLIGQLEQLTQVYSGVAESVKAKAQTMAASLRAVSGATEEGRTSTKNAASDADRLTKAYEALNFARSETAKKIAELKACEPPLCEEVGGGDEEHLRGDEASAGGDG